MYVAQRKTGAARVKRPIRIAHRRKKARSRLGYLVIGTGRHGELPQEAPIEGSCGVRNPTQLCTGMSHVLVRNPEAAKQGVLISHRESREQHFFFFGVWPIQLKGSVLDRYQNTVAC